MIYPTESEANKSQRTLRKRIQNINPLFLFYFIGITIMVSNIIPIFTASKSEIDSITRSERDWQTVYYFTSSFVLSVPLLIEFTLDFIVLACYPVYGRNVFEHKFGHFLVLISLTLPLVVVLSTISSEDQLVFNPLFDKCFVNGCQSLAITGIFGTLQYIDKANWQLTNSLTVILLFFGSQAAVNFAVTDCAGPNDCHLRVEALVPSLVCAILALLVHMLSSRRYFLALYRVAVGEGRAHYSTDQYTSSILVTMVALYLSVRLSFAIGIVAESHGEQSYDLVAATKR